MEALITSGRLIKCKEFQGGIRKLYLLPFVKYARSQIKVVDSELVLFPASDYYLFESVNEIGITQSMSENEGGKFYSYSFELLLHDYAEIDKFLKVDFRAIAEDRNGNSIMLGLYNGITANNSDRSSGSAKTDFNGYKISFDGQEQYEAPFLNIQDLETAYLLQENGDYLLQENLGKFIIN